MDAVPPYGRTWWLEPLKQLPAVAAEIFHIWVGQEDRCKYRRSDDFLLTHSWVPAHGMVLLIFRGGSLPLLSPPWGPCHRHAQGCVSWVISNHHTPSGWNLVYSFSTKSFSVLLCYCCLRLKLEFSAQHMWPPGHWEWPILSM